MLVMKIRARKRGNARRGISIPEVGCLAAVLAFNLPSNRAWPAIIVHRGVTNAQERSAAATPVIDVAGKIASLSRFRAFSSEVDTGSREENASKQKIRARF
jgi:hypothetical protein